MIKEKIIEELRDKLQEIYYKHFGNIEYTFSNAEDFTNFLTPELQTFFLTKYSLQKQEMFEKGVSEGMRRAGEVSKLVFNKQK